MLQVADDAEYKLKHCFVQTVQLISALVDSSELRACVPGRARLSVVLMSFFGSDKAVRAAIYFFAKTGYNFFILHKQSIHRL